MSDTFSIKLTFPVAPDTIYNAWLNSDEHSKMTGAPASIKPMPHTEFTAWDGYIFGKNLKLIPGEKIVQSWRTTDFAKEDEDSEIEIILTETEEGCELILIHSRIPDNQPDYKQGWMDFYFEPMKIYFQ